MTTSFPPTPAPTSAPTTFAPTAAPTTTPLPTTTPSPPTSAPPTSAPTTFAPTSMPTTPAPTSAPTTFAPTSAPTTAAPTTAAPVPAGLSPAGMVNVNVCISGNTAEVTLEGLSTQNVAWNGSSFSSVVFPAFNTVNNTYPAYTVSGQIVGGDLQVTVQTGSTQSVFTLAASGSGGCAT